MHVDDSFVSRVILSLAHFEQMRKLLVPKGLSYKKVVVCSNKVVAHSSKEVRTREEEDSFHCVNRSKDPTDFL